MQPHTIRRAHVPNATLTAGEFLDAVARPMPVDRAERSIEEMLGLENVVLFASARGALAAAIASFAQDATVALPAYTCIAVANAVRSAGATPRYVDVDERGLVPADRWIDADLVVAQDTYGFVSELPPGRPVVRDCAHRSDLVRTRDSIVRITSFEHSKWLATGQGGLAATEDAELAKAMRRARDSHPTSGSPLRHAGVTVTTCLDGRLQFAGRRRASRWARRIPSALAPDRLAGQSEQELHGNGVARELLGRPNQITAKLIVSQLAKLNAIADSRSRVVATYDRVAGVQRDSEPLVRYPLIADEPSSVETHLLERGWDITGRWFNAPLHPAHADSLRLGFTAGSAPNAEKLAATVVNLPTHPLVGEAEATRLVELALEAGARPLT